MMRHIGRQVLFLCILMGLLVPCHISADAYPVTDENGNVLTDENGNVLYRDDSGSGGGFLVRLALAIIAVRNGEPGAVKHLVATVSIAAIAAIVFYFVVFHGRVCAWLRKRRSGG